MKRSAIILVLLFSSNMLSLSQNGNKNQTEKGSELFEQLVQIATSILQGKNYSEFRENISTETYVINNNSYESIFELLSNPSKREMFVEGKGTKTGFIHLWLPDNQNEAYLVLETKSEDTTKTNWHSILFKYGENQKWQILSWHKS